MYQKVTYMYQKATCGYQKPLNIRISLFLILHYYIILIVLYI